MRKESGGEPKSENGPDSIKDRLHTINNFAVYMEGVFEGNTKFSALPEEEQEKVRKGAAAIIEHLEVMREAFDHKEYIPDALRVADRLMVLPGMGARILPLLAGSSEKILAYIREYPKDLSLPLKVLSFTKMFLDTHAEMEDDKDSRRRSAKLMTTMTQALPDFELYFSEANPADDEELLERFLSLSSLLVLTSERKTTGEWVVKQYQRLMAALLMGDGYTKTPEKVEDGGLGYDRLLASLRSIPRREIIKRLLVAHDNRSGSIDGIMVGLCEQLGMPEDYFIVGLNVKNEAWTLDQCVDSTPKEGEATPIDIILDQLEAIRALERERPGAAAILFRAYGIRFFSRYPTELLVKQFDERDINTPYGIVMTGVWDSNNAFFEKANSHDFYKKMSAQLRATGHRIRFIEATGNEELERHFNFMRTAYGEGNKASFLLMRAHGHTWSLGLGPDENKGYLLHSHLTKRNYEQFKDVFIEDFTTIFDGCAMGRSGGICEEWSRVFQSVVYAPKGISTGHFEVDIRPKEKGLEFTPRYEINGSSKLTPARKYKNGREYSSTDGK